ncbi:hypothetical protein [Halocatena halophila]|uniref:hypothetical protein n=1 Tax=Halocatena halophila TaxID=2814576 RepID=UPI002ED09234
MSVAITELVCPNCEHRFELGEALRIRCRGPQTTEISCRRCRHMISRSISPDRIDRPPQPKGRSFVTDKDGHKVGRLLFSDSVWYQFRETPDGIVEEVVKDGETKESIPAQRLGLPIDSIEDEIQNEERRLENLTVAGLRLQRPALAAQLLE